MVEQQIEVLREQIDILEKRQATVSTSRRAALNVIKRHDLMMEYASEIVTLSELGEEPPVVEYAQTRPFSFPYRDCSSVDIEEVALSVTDIQDETMKILDRIYFRLPVFGPKRHLLWDDANALAALANNPERLAQIEKRHFIERKKAAEVALWVAAMDIVGVERRRDWVADRLLRWIECDQGTVAMKAARDNADG